MSTTHIALYTYNMRTILIEGPNITVSELCMYAYISI